MRRSALLLAAAAFMAACVDEPGTTPRPAAQHAASGGPKIAVRQITNQSHQFGLEDALMSAVRDEFLRDGRYQLVPENEAEYVVAATITSYLLTPLAYDSTLAPISYKLRIIVDIQLLDRATNRALWGEKDIEGSLTYPSSNLAGGQTEDSARATIWTVLAPMIVARVVDGVKVSPPKAAGTPGVK